MPNYFYHLKFELYPSAAPTKTQTTLQKAVWLPRDDADIFDTKDWVSHNKPANERADITELHSGPISNEECLDSGLHAQGQAQACEVIDCGPSRPLTIDILDPLVPTHSPYAATVPQLKPGLTTFDPAVAVKDWRFGHITVESLDMVPSKRPEPARHSSNREPDDHGLQAVAAGGTSVRVTKAAFETAETKNTEIGWGVVHLYRDGEETPGLGTGIEIYNAGTVADEVSNNEGEDQSMQECTKLCIPAVPSYLTPSDFLGFVGEKTREEVSHFRMVMTGRMNRYLVLMKFRDGKVARKWRSDWDGKAFNSMEPETCHVVFIKSITFNAPSNSAPGSSFPELSCDPFTPATSNPFLKPFPPPTPNLVELPTCPVCLERMDDTSGLLTIPCQHVFHCACLQKWRGTGCPVCRHTNPSLAIPQHSSLNSSYDSTNSPFGSGEASLCRICDCSDDLWICLICGNVGCGRYKGGHAKEHWKSSGHNFALEIETQHVWDYADDVWVHRLIRDKGDGKVVELPSSRGSGGRLNEANIDMVPREKLEGIGMEYTHLLTSQLESQRIYYEDLVGKAVGKASAATAAAASANSRAEEIVANLETMRTEHERLRNEVLVGLEKDLVREKKKAEKNNEIARGLSKTLTEEKKVSEGLMKRIGHVNASMMAMSKELTAAKEENADLSEQNRDLLFSITGQQKLQEMGADESCFHTGELESGTVSLPPQPEQKKGKGKGKARS